MGNEVEIETIRVRELLSRSCRFRQTSQLFQVSSGQTKLSRDKAHDVPTLIRPTYN